MDSIDVLKKLIQVTLPKGLQHRIRRAVLVRKIVGEQAPHEPEIDVVAQLVQPGDTVLDIGANVGLYTKVLSTMAGPGGRVYAFEPVAENFDILQAVIHKASLNNVQAFRMALGGSSGECEIVVPATGTFTGYYLAHIARAGEAGWRQKVDLKTLDRLLAARTIESPLFVKCDVEGAELALLQGAKELIEGQECVWLIEVAKKTSAEVFDLFHMWGYGAYVWQEGRLVKTKRYLDRQFSNYFFLHPEGPVTGRVSALLTE